MSWHQFVVFVHVVAAALWVGGIFFLGLVAVPIVRRLDDGRRAALMADMGRRFRTLGYTLLSILIVTGILQAQLRGATIENVLSGEFFSTRFGAALAAKLLFFAAMLVISVVHDFVVGPAAIRAAEAGKDPRRLRKTASWLARLTALLALAVVAYAVMMVR